MLAALSVVMLGAGCQSSVSNIPPEESTAITRFLTQYDLAGKVVLIEFGTIGCSKSEEGLDLMINLFRYTDGKMQSLSSYAGKGGLMLVFVDINCPFAGQAMKELPNVAAKLAQLKLGTPAVWDRVARAAEKARGLAAGSIQFKAVGTEYG